MLINKKKMWWIETLILSIVYVRACARARARVCVFGGGVKTGIVIQK